LRRGLAAVAQLASLAAIGILVVLLASVEAHLDYLANVLSSGSAAATPLSLPGWLRDRGWGELAAVSLPIASALAIAAIVALRQRPCFAFVTAVAAATLLTPTMRQEVLAGLVAAAAPWIPSRPDVWPLRLATRRQIVTGSSLVAVVLGVAALISARIGAPTLLAVNDTSRPAILRIGVVASIASVGYWVGPKSAGFAYRGEPGNLTESVVVLDEGCQKLRGESLVAAQDVVVRITGRGVDVASEGPLRNGASFLPLDRRCTDVFGGPRP